MVQNPSWRFGIYGGLVAMVYTMILYNLDPISLYAGPLAYLPVLIYAAAIIFALRSASASREGAFDFKSASKTAFVCILVAMAMNQLLNFTLLRMDPTLSEIQREGSMRLFTDYLSGFLGEENLNQMIRNIETADLKPTFGKAFTLYFRSIIPAFIMSAVLSLFFIRRD